MAVRFKFARYSTDKKIERRAIKRRIRNKLWKHHKQRIRYKRIITGEFINQHKKQELLL